MNNIKSKYNSILLINIIVLTFIGFYFLNILAVNAGMAEYTRQISIPIRIVIVFNCILLFSRSYKNKKPLLSVFIFFAFVYSLRIFFDFLHLEYFYISYSELVFYFISFSVIPFISIISVDFSKINIDAFFNFFLFFSFGFSILTVLLYSKYLGVVSRLATSSVGEDVISPLILSYCATLILGVIIFYLIFNKVSKIKKAVCFCTIGLATVPFFLGSSRGSIFAFFVPFVMLLFSSFSFKSLFRNIFLFTTLLLILIYLDNYFKSGLLMRFIGTTEAIEMGGHTASRLQLWEISINQFLNNPFFGDKLNTEVFNHHPHNIFLEVLQSTGILGFIPFFILVGNSVKYSVLIFRTKPKYAWIALFFLQPLMQNMFSKALYTSAWFWTGLALLISFENYLFNKESTY